MIKKIMRCYLYSILLIFALKWKSSTAKSHDEKNEELQYNSMLALKFTGMAGFDGCPLLGKIPL